MKRKRDMFEDDDDHESISSTTTEDSVESASAPSLDSEVASIPATATSLQSPTDEIMTNETSVELPEPSPITDLAAAAPVPVSVSVAVPGAPPIPPPVPPAVPAAAVVADVPETMPAPAAPIDEDMDYSDESDYVNSSDSSVDEDEEEETEKHKYFGCQIQARQENFRSTTQLHDLLIKKSNSLLKRNIAIFEQVISGTNVQDRDEHGNTFLIMKVTTGDIEGFKQVLPICKSMNALDLQNKHGDTALITSLYLGLRHGHNDTALERKISKKMCRRLIEAGADVNKKTIHGYSALEIAAKNDLSNQLHDLLVAGARVDGCFEWNKMTALHCAVARDNIHSVRELITFGADLSRRCLPLGSTPLMIAKYSEMTKLLLTAGSNVNEADLNGRTPLMIRADRYYDHDWKALAEVQVILDYKADVNLKDNHGQTALVIAIQRRNYAIARLLIPKSLPTLNSREGYHGNALTEHVTRYGSRDASYYELLEALLEAGADPNILSWNNVSPIMSSVRRYDHKAITILGKYGADPNYCRKSTGDTAMHMLLDPVYLDADDAYLGFYPAFDALIAIGADIEAKNKDGRTLLNDICYEFMRHGNSRTPADFVGSYVRRGCHKFDYMQYLISKGANINTVSKCGSTPLHYAVRSRYPASLKWVQVLLENDADDSLVDIPAVDSYSNDFNPAHPSQGLKAVEYFVRGGNDIESWDRMKAKVTSPKLTTALNCILTAVINDSGVQETSLEAPLKGFFNRDGALDMLPKIMEMWVGEEVCSTA